MSPIKFFAWIKTHLILIGGVIISIMFAIIQGMRRDKEKVKADLAEGEAKSLKKAIKAQQTAQQTTSELIEEANEKRRRNDFSDID